MSVGRLLEEGHYTQQRLNEEVSKKFLQTYLELLDFSHLFFTQQDVDELNAKYGNSIEAMFFSARSSRPTKFTIFTRNGLTTVSPK